MKALRLTMIIISAVWALCGSTVFAASVDCKVLVDAVWDDIRPYSDGMAAVMNKAAKEGTGGKKVEADVWGFINDEGKNIIEPEYKSTGDFHEGVVWVISDSGTGSTGAVEVQIINKKGEVVLDANKLEKGRYYGATDCSGGIIGFWTDAGYMDYYDLNGKYIAGNKSNPAGDQGCITKGWHFTDGVACIGIKTKDGMNAGYIDKNGIIAYSSNQIEEIRPYNNGLAPALDKASSKWGVIDKEGRWVIAPQFDDWLIRDQYGYQLFSVEGIAVVKQNGKWGAIDNKGNVIIKIEHDYLSFFKSGYTVYRINEDGKFGIYDMKGVTAAAPRYDGMLTKASRGIIPVLWGNKFGYIGLSGNEILKPQYDDISNFIDGVALVRKNNVYCWIDTMGNTIGGLGRSINKLGFDQEDGIIEFVSNGKSGLFKITVNYIKVLLNGTEIYFDQEPVIKNGRTLVPMRAVFEAMGATVEWDGESQTIKAVKDGRTVIMIINHKAITIDGVRLELDVEPQIINGRTLVPVRAVAESLDAEVTWDGVTKTVIIKKAL